MNPTTWHYYNHALLPDCAPHEAVVFASGKFDVPFNCGGGVPLMARWTSDFDCARKTSWWYEIVACLRPFRKRIKRQGSALQRQVWGVLQMDSIVRGCTA